MMMEAKSDDSRLPEVPRWEEPPRGDDGEVGDVREVGQGEDPNVGDFNMMDEDTDSSYNVLGIAVGNLDHKT